MKAIILAAGMGTRLGRQIPKPLTILNNKRSILDFAVEKISKHLSMDDIFVVVGYKKEMIMEKYPDLNFIHNENYKKTNTSKSLLKALKKINEDVLFLNGDIFFDEEVVLRLITNSNSCVLVDNKKCSEEEVKYTTDKNGHIKEISKEISKAKGEALGINFIKKEDIEIFIDHLNLVEDQDYFEKAIENMIIKDKIKILPIDSSDLFCHEIDFIEDLDFVKNYLIDDK